MMGKTKRRRQEPYWITTYEVSPDATILEQFQAVEKEGGLDAVVRSLSLLNATLLALPETAIEEKRQEIIEWYQYFDLNYYENEKLWEKIYENWGDLPLCYRMGVAFQEEELAAKSREAYVRLSDVQKERVKALVQYLFTFPAKRRVLFAYNLLDREERGITYELELPCKIVKDDEEMYQKALFQEVVFVATCKGSLVMEHFDHEQKKRMFCAFSGENGDLRSVPAKKLKKNMEENPDGTRSIYPDERYVEVDVFPNLQ